MNVQAKILYKLSMLFHVSIELRLNLLKIIVLKYD